MVWGQDGDEGDEVYVSGRVKVAALLTVLGLLLVNSLFSGGLLSY